MNEFNRIDFVFSGSNLKWYLNGNFSGQTPINPITSIDYDNTTSTFIGKHGYSTPRWTDGKLDNITIWGNTLTASEINQYMNCPPLGNEAELLMVESLS